MKFNKLSLFALFFSMLHRPVFADAPSPGGQAPSSERQLLRNQRTVAVEMLLQLNAQNPNSSVSFSPAGLYNVLSLAWLTNNQSMRTFVGKVFGQKPELLRGFSLHFENLYKRLTQAPGLQFALGYFHQANTGAGPSFGSQVDTQILPSEGLRAAEIVNKWAHRELVSPKAWSKTVPRVFLAERLDFKAEWTKPMDTEEKGEFFSGSNQRIPIYYTKAMWEDIAYMKATDLDTKGFYHAVWLPYKGPLTGNKKMPRLQVLLVLPPRGVSMKEAIPRMDELLSQPKGWQATNITFLLPVTTVETGAAAMQNALLKMGGIEKRQYPQFIDAAHSLASSATFSFARAGTQGQSLTMVEENGTKKNERPEMGAPLVPDTIFYPHVSLTFDHPFLFAVLDVETDTLLFVGIVNTPKAIVTRK